MFLLAILVTGRSCTFAQEESGQDEQQQEIEGRSGYLVQVPLPIDDRTAGLIEQQIQAVVDEASTIVSVDQRPVLVLEFDTSNGVTGQGSELGNCLDIAVLLSGKNLQGLYTVAYIPRGKGFFNENEGPPSQLKGHAALIALACNEIAMHEDSAFGQAGINAPANPSLELGTYQNIAERRSKYPLAWVNAIVDKGRALYRISNSASDVSYVDAKERSAEQAAGNIVESTTLNSPGTLPMFSSQEMQQMRLIRNRVSSRNDLANRLGIDPNTLENQVANRGVRIAAELPINNFVDSPEADWTLRMLGNQMASQPETNMLIVRLNTPGGDIDACLRIAQELAKLNPKEVFTVAWVESPAVGPTSLIALACDQIVMTTEGVLGTAGDVPVTAQELEDSIPLIQRICEEKQVGWSLAQGLIDPDLSVSRYRNTRSGQFQILSAEELAEQTDPKMWTAVESIDLSRGLSATEAIRMGISRPIVDDYEQFKTSFQLLDDPIRLEPSPADKWIKNLARELASPWIAAWLLFGAVFLLSTEMSNPGIGIPGFLGTLCLMMFFWSQYLDGNANWLEILLFVVGVVFVLLEVFVIPGFGVFGIGGLIMIVAGIVLASQTFIIPRNSEELARLPASLSMVLAAGSGFFAGIFFIRKYLTTMPIFRRIMLQPPTADESLSPEQRDQKESLVDRRHMIGKTGTTMTPLVPAGKAQIGNDLIDVISDGRLIERNLPIRVIEVTGNRVVVESVESSS
ncbi:MAG: hypothetical protein GY819_17315 [Planctomycetaceae bacterium]|nr:hypothetical protein [Planctomycetaceae bacterium]